MCTKFGVDNFARRLTGAATWRTRRNTTSCPLAPLCENMTLFITPEVHNVLHICHRTEPWPQVKFTENFIRDLDTWFFRYARAQTDNQTDMNSDTLIIILCISGRTKKNEVGGGATPRRPKRRDFDAVYYTGVHNRIWGKSPITPEIRALLYTATKAYRCNNKSVQTAEVTSHHQ